MHQRPNKSYPYPVLSPVTDDYMGSSFSSDVKSYLNGSEIVIQLSCTLNDEKLQNLLDEGLASIVYHIECPNASFRMCMKTDGKPAEIRIPLKKVRSNIEVNTFMTANEDIKSYRNEHFNSDYDAEKFDIESGCILALCKEKDILIKPELSEKLEKNESFVIAIPSKDPNLKEIQFNVDDPHKLLAVLPQHSFDLYSQMNKYSQNRDLLNSLYIIPTLYGAMNYLSLLDANTLEANCEASDWIASLDSSLEIRLGLKLSDLKSKKSSELYELAQKLCGSPIEAATKRLFEMK